MTTVYLLWHSHQLEGGDDDKLIGVYSTGINAREAIERLKGMPGFKDFPGGFIIDEYTLDKDNWIEGFLSSRDALREIDSGGKDR